MNRSRLAAIFAIFFLAGLAACGPASAPAPDNSRHDEARREEPRQDAARQDEAGRDEPRRRESKSERRRRREEREVPASSPTSSTSQTTSSGQTHDLSADEAQGGHTLSRHVGRSDADLQERLEREGNISAASTYTDRAAAEAVVGQVLEHNSRVEQWEQRGGRRPNLALDYHGDASHPIGRCMERGSSAAVPAWDAIVVLKASRDGDGFYVLTTYPECPR